MIIRIFNFHEKLIQQNYKCIAVCVCVLPNVFFYKKLAQILKSMKPI